MFAAASLKEPLDRMAEMIPGVVVSYGGSGAQARQVRLGAPADVVVLANTDWMDVLLEDGLLEGGDVADIASNRLVLIGTNDQEPLPLTAEALRMALRGGRLALGLTEAVPAGIYAKEALESLQIWPAVQNRLAEVDNVRAVLALVARGQAPLGIVYATDARVSADVAILSDVPAETHSPIRYQAGLLSDTVEARAFFEFMQGHDGQGHLADAGFLPPLGPTK